MNSYNILSHGLQERWTEPASHHLPLSFSFSWSWSPFLKGTTNSDEAAGLVSVKLLGPQVHFTIRTSYVFPFFGFPPTSILKLPVTGLPNSFQTRTILLSCISVGHPRSSETSNWCGDARP